MRAVREQSRLRLVGSEQAAEQSVAPLAEAARSPLAPPVAPLPAAAVDAQPRTRAQILGELPDGELVALGSKGNRLALEMLYKRHISFAIHLATRIEGSSRDVEDIVHDAFIKAFERLPDLTDPAAFKGWLGSIVVHAVRSRLRRGRLMTVLGLSRGADVVELDELASETASPLVRAQIAQIYALLRTLAVDERIAWTLRAIEGHDLDTVAKLTNCSLATAKRRIAKAQRFLDDHFVDPHQSGAEVCEEES